MHQDSSPPPAPGPDASPGVPLPGATPSGAWPVSLLAVTAGRGDSLVGARLAGSDLSGRDLTCIDLRGADLREASLTGSKLHEGRLRRARLDGADLRRVIARDLDLEAAVLGGADLSDARLDGAILLEADLRGACLVRAELSRADLRGTVLAGADLTQADLSGSDLSGADLSGATLQDLRWHRARISGVRGLSPEQRATALAAGAWDGAVAPELAPVVRIAGLAAAPARRAACRAAQGVRDRLVAWREQAGERRGGRDDERARDAAQKQAERLARLPGGPGADLSGQDLSGRHLEEVDWSGATVDGANLQRAHLQQASLGGASFVEARMSGARLRGAGLATAVLRGADLTDADLREADLRGASLQDADLTGVDLRGALLDGCDLTGADLTAARLADCDLRTTTLDRAIFDQADLAGADLLGASVQGADLRGALGLSPAAFEQLAARGARVTEAGLGELLRRVQPRHVLALGGSVAAVAGLLVLARVIAGQDPALTGGGDDAVAALHGLPAEEARARFEALAEDAESAPDRVGYLREAAAQARRMGDEDGAIDLLRQAMTAAGDDVELSGEVRLNLAERLAARAVTVPEAADEARAVVLPLLELEQQPVEQRARAMLVYEAMAGDDDARADAEARLAAVHGSLSQLPDGHAELYVALASGRAARGDLDGALAELDLAAALETTGATTRRVAELHARTLEQAGRTEEALAAWRALVTATADGSDGRAAATLALADLLQRSGQSDEARTLVKPLLAPGGDPRLLARAWLVQAHVHEDAAELRPAAEAFKSAIEAASAAGDPTTAEQARTSLARLVGSADDDTLRALAADLGADAAAMIEAQGELGRAMALLEANDPGTARSQLEALLERPDLDDGTRREARTALGEALALQGDVPAALVVWRDLLAETEQPQDRVWLELRIAQGLVRGGRHDEAAEAYERLAESGDAEVAVQGRLGMAQVALARGEVESARALLEDVASSDADGSWRVRALEELAMLAVETGDHAEAAARWKAVVALSQDDAPQAARARIAMVEALVSAEALPDARAACAGAIAGAPDALSRVGALLLCADVDERLGQPAAALDGYSAALEALDEDASHDTVVDAVLGGVRAGLAADRADRAVAVVDQGLARVGDDVAARLALLGAKERALLQAGDTPAATVVRRQRDALLARAPASAVDVIVEAGHAARGRGESAQGAALLARAVELTEDDEAAAALRLELGDAWLEAGDVAQALAAYTAAEADGDAGTRVFAAMGRAEVLRRSGDPAGAAALLGTLSAPDEESARLLAEARARALTEAGADDEAAEAWEDLAAEAGDGDGAAAALQGRADLAFGDDRFDQALTLYVQAAETATDTAQQGWAQLGAARSRTALGDTDAAAAGFTALMRHPDPEVALQARLERSRLAAGTEDWKTALDALPASVPPDFGAGWDASVAEARAAAQVGQGDLLAARQTWEGLARRWPDDEEAEIPAWLGLAEVARARGDLRDARAWATKAVERARDPGYAEQAKAVLASLDDG
ncbi:MAG: pentapeptide repeat-containing protein [Alphaproteobacteria bacterium]|nr:pentapeptide repeat-containing protein [Alphaproteobacteria bacterium]